MCNGIHTIQDTDFFKTMEQNNEKNNKNKCKESYFYKTSKTSCEKQIKKEVLKLSETIVKVVSSLQQIPI